MPPANLNLTSRDSSTVQCTRGCVSREIPLPKFQMRLFKGMLVTSHVVATEDLP